MLFAGHDGKPALYYLGTLQQIPYEAQGIRRTLCYQCSINYANPI